MAVMILPYPNEITLSEKRRLLQESDLRLEHDDAIEPEGYRLEIDAHDAVLASSTDAGRFYGLQTFRQLQDADGFVPLCTISDAPRFSWRGFMVDSSRHIQTIDEIKAMIDAAAAYKLNIFHWHLCDDQGWRIESERYPLLHTVGGWRDGWGFGNPNPEKYGGWFTKAQIREIVQYCAERFITVVPEFDMPGHCSAVLKAYPAFSCSGESCDVNTEAGVFSNVLCAGKEETFDFCCGVLEEIMELFPGKYIHIGGDEVPKDGWNNCPHCQKRMQDVHLADAEALQGYFTTRIARFLRANGKTPIGWNEVLEADLAPGEIVATKWWDQKGLCDDFANRGGKVIMEETRHVYLDYNYQTTSLRQSYSYDLLPDSFTEAGKQNVLGIEAPIWTEWVEDFKRMGYQVYPRLLAVAERGWTYEPQDYNGFKARAEAQRDALGARGIVMAPYADWDPED